MLKLCKFFVVVLGCVVLLFVLVMGLVMVQDSGQVQWVDWMVVQVGWQWLFILIVDGLIVEDFGLGVLDGLQCVCVVWVFNVILDEVMCECLVEWMIVDQVQFWLDFVVILVGVVFMVVFVVNMQVKLEFGDDSQVLLLVLEFCVEVEVFMLLVLFMVFVRVFFGQFVFNFR